MLKHFIKYLAGDIVVKLLGFISLPLYTYFLLPEEYGVYSLILSYATIAIVLFTLNVHASVSRFYYDKSLDVSKFMTTTVSLSIIILLLSFGILYQLGSERLSELLGFDFDRYGVFFLLFIVFGIFFDIYKNTLVPQKKSKEYSFLLVSKTYVTFIFIIFILYFINADALNMLYGLILAEIILFIYVIKNIYKYFSLKVDIEASKYILNYSVFLMPYVLSAVVMAQIDRIMLANYYSTFEVGIYSVAYTLSMVPLMLFNSFGNAWTPNYFKYMDEKNYDKLKSDVTKILFGILIIVFLVSLFSKEIVWILLDAKYNKALEVLPILTISVFFMVLWQMWGRGIGYMRKTIWSSIIGLLSAVLNIWLNTYLIPLYNMQGAVYATLVSYIFMAFLGYFVSKHILKIYTVPFLSLKYIFLLNIVTFVLAIVDNQYILNSIKIIVIGIGIYGFFKYKSMIWEQLMVQIKAKN